MKDPVLATIIGTTAAGRRMVMSHRTSGTSFVFIATHPGPLNLSRDPVFAYEGMESIGYPLFTTWRHW
ncbi:MAG: hypothetical protein E6Q97_12420 [Desulfurellales bacterium]|nr:MAG: hypothetical protein E6Q97_12420 [Desulfurellales bacterium]